MKLIIAGIDPGTTIGYAFLNLNGELINISSSRSVKLSFLIEEAINHGKPLVVGTDVNPAPSFVEKFASDMGAKLITPDHKLSFKEKRKLVDTFLKNLDKRIKISNKHEMDALASAIHAHKRLKKLFLKIDDSLSDINKAELSDEVKRIVLTKEIPIKKVISLISEEIYL